MNIGSPGWYAVQFGTQMSYREMLFGRNTCDWLDYGSYCECSECEWERLERLHASKEN